MEGEYATGGQTRVARSVVRYGSRDWDQMVICDLRGPVNQIYAQRH